MTGQNIEKYNQCLTKDKEQKQFLNTFLSNATTSSLQVPLKLN